MKTDTPTKRQQDTLRALAELDTQDVRTSEWRGAFGAITIARLAGCTTRKAHNDLEGLLDAGMVARDMNMQWRITTKGRKELERVNQWRE